MKNYTQQELTIPSYIWNDKKLNGIQKMMYALYVKIGKNTAEQTFYPRKQAQIFNTHTKDVTYNFGELVKKNYIIIISGETIDENSTDVTYTINRDKKPTFDSDEILSKLF